MTKTRRQGWSSERGTAILETAMTLPLLLLVSVGIFEFGRAYQTWQVLTNAAREGARVAVLPNPVAGAPEARVRQYLTSGQLSNAGSATVAVTGSTVDIGGGATASASIVTVSYPFSFIVLQPVARLLVSGSTLGGDLTLVASSEMRNESQ
ncbi:MAG: pilus assembly protein TadE [Acidobacteria bacterium]|nr:MAG: pilus assembly protein TadE [Acidobacteriota bacterium]